MASSKSQILEAFSCLNRPCHSVMTRESCLAPDLEALGLLLFDHGRRCYERSGSICGQARVYSSYYTSFSSYLIVFVYSHRLLHHPTGRALGFLG
jgi:hypothetical protein